MLPNCPKSFYLNCQNALRLCHHCRAARAELDYKKPLHYKPILGFKTHPAEGELFRPQRSAAQKAGKRAQRRGIQFEKQHVKAMNAKPTVQSGRIFNDGDLTINVLGRTLSFDCKLRSGRSFSISRKVYDAGIQSGINGWILGLETDGAPKETCVLLTYETFSYLVNSLQGESDGCQ